ncbi:MAG: M20/M25/M40 family metallo-hydrolase [Cyanobacteria bacterium]|nr:M20/M25/M40 family metallo-hydrolase [Cyanobacteriota bacterium]
MLIVLVKKRHLRKKLFIAIGIVIALIGCLPMLSFGKLPSYRGPVEPLSQEQQLLATRLRSHVQKLAVDIGARSLPKSPGGLERAATYIEEKFSDARLNPTRQTFSVAGYFNDGLFGATHATQSTSNIIVELTGGAKASEIVVIGAHYDAVGDCPGANDNASGVAALIEIASALANEKFERTIRFVAFTNEEPPFFRSDDMGSYRYAKACKDRGDNIVAMLSLETIGYYSDKPDSQQFPLDALSMIYPKCGNFLAFVGNMEAYELLKNCFTSFTSAVKFPVELIAAPASLSGIDFSDQLSFWRVGYPGVMVTDTALYRYPHYHTNKDTPEKLSYDQLSRVTTGLQKVVQDLGGGN